MRISILIALAMLLGSMPAYAAVPTGQVAEPVAELAARPAQMAEPLLPTYRVIAYYGNPLAPVLGRLGELPPDEMVARLRQTVAFYAEVDPARPIKPALELITPLAQSGAGEDGLYRARMSNELIEDVATLAADNDLLLILDVQVGLSSVADEVAALLPYLRRPNTHLALDPEFAMPPGEVPGQTIGSLDATEINTAIQMLAEVVETEQIPPKMLIVHRFLPSMITNDAAIQVDPRVQVVIDMDGFGGPAAKISKYNEFVRDAGLQIFGGLKLFYQYDTPLLSPEEVLALDPPPDVIIYQ